jgi:hypothetical protein
MPVLFNRMDLYNSSRRLLLMKNKLKEMKDGDKAIKFLEHLEAKGLNTLTVLKYSTQLPRIMKELGINADKKQVEEFIRKINMEQNYTFRTKRAYKQTLENSTSI